MSYLNILFSCPALCHRPAPLPRSPAGQGRGVRSSLNTLLQPLWDDALGLLSAVREEGPAIAFRLWLQGGVGGETLCLFYYVSLYHSTQYGDTFYSEAL